MKQVFRKEFALEQLKRILHLANKASLSQLSGDDATKRAYLIHLDEEIDILGDDAKWPLRQHLQSVRYSLQNIRKEEPDILTAPAIFIKGHEDGVLGRKSKSNTEVYQKGFRLGHDWKMKRSF